MRSILLFDIVFPSWIHVQLPKRVKAWDLVIDGDEMPSFVSWMEKKASNIIRGQERLPFLVCVHAIMPICLNKLKYWQQAQRCLILSRLVSWCWRLLYSYFTDWMNFYLLSNPRKLDNRWKSFKVKMALKTVLSANKANKGRNVRGELLDWCIGIAPNRKQCHDVTGSTSFCNYITTVLWHFQPLIPCLIALSCCLQAQPPAIEDVFYGPWITIFLSLSFSFLLLTITSSQRVWKPYAWIRFEVMNLSTPPWNLFAILIVKAKNTQH